MSPVLDNEATPGLALAGAVLGELGTDPDAIRLWTQRRVEQAVPLARAA